MLCIAIENQIITNFQLSNNTSFKLFRGLLLVLEQWIQSLWSSQPVLQELRTVLSQVSYSRINEINNLTTTNCEIAYYYASPHRSRKSWKVIGFSRLICKVLLFETLRQEKRVEVSGFRNLKSSLSKTPSLDLNTRQVYVHKRDGFYCLWKLKNSI